jgi:DNA-binding MarR family transcriptional regulator/N-acetylglutamate synthase-like GNAT family acetyltransferase
MDFEQRIAAMRRFNRLYTQKIGVLEEGLLTSRFSLTEARVLYELANRERPTAVELGRDLGLDAGYLSRILGSFERQGLLRKETAPTDRRASLLRLTDAGERAFAPLDARSREEIGAMLARLTAAEQDRLLGAMTTIEHLLMAPPEAREAFQLRPHRPGDMGWVVHRHGALYAQEYGWDSRFEALVADIVAQFIRKFEPARERCWMAEVDGNVVGSVFVVRQSRTVAKLRLLLVEPSARGLGLGQRLVAECIAFARQAGYRQLKLWTNANLLAARKLYMNAGFQLIESEPHHSFGHDLVGETWVLKL